MPIPTIIAPYNLSGFKPPSALTSVTSCLGCFISASRPSFFSVAFLAFSLSASTFLLRFCFSSSSSLTFSRSLSACLNFASSPSFSSVIFLTFSSASCLATSSSSLGFCSASALAVSNSCLASSNSFNLA